MNVDCLNYCVTDEQVRQFREDGYLIVKQALPSDWVSRLLTVVDEIDASVRARNDFGPSVRVSLFDIFRLDDNDILLELIDYPTVFPLVWGLLGPAIQVYMSHLVVYPSEGVKPKPQQYIHRDGAAIREDLKRESVFPEPMLSFKVSFWLTDVVTPEYGAIRIIPGSHKLSDGYLHNISAKAIHLCVDAGDVIIHDRRVVHSRGLNTSDVIRKTIFMGYGYRWLRKLGNDKVSAKVIERCKNDPIRLQLLGEPFGWNSYWEPSLLPLKDWLDTHGII